MIDQDSVSTKAATDKLHYRYILGFKIIAPYSFFSKNASCQFFSCIFYVVYVILIPKTRSKAKLNFLSVEINIKKIKLKLKIWCEVKIRLKFESQKWGAIIFTPSLDITSNSLPYPPLWPTDWCRHSSAETLRLVNISEKEMITTENGYTKPKHLLPLVAKKKKRK